MASQRSSNLRLRTLLNESGLTGQSFAEAVNVVAAEAGFTVRYDRTSVAHWLTGTRPPPHVASAAAEALHRALGRPVTAVDTGLLTLQDGDPPVDRGLWWEIDAVTRLMWLDTRPGRRHPSDVSVFTMAGMSVPDLVMLPTAVRPATDSPRSARVGSPQVRAATLMLTVFSDADTTFGGGRALSALRAYISADIATWLRAETTAANRRRLSSVAAQLAYLAAFMCFDSGLHGAAQGYHHAALQLAAEASDQGSYATVLRGMSVQAHSLGHHSDCLHLAEAAVRHHSAVPDVTAAFLTGQLAVAHSANGDKSTALALLGDAERQLERADGSQGPIGSYHHAALAHQRAEVLAACGDRPGAIKALSASLQQRPAGENRARAITTARLAGLQMDLGHLDAACTTWRRFCTDYRNLQSGRADQALRNMRARLHPYRRNAGVRLLMESTAGLGPVTTSAAHQR